jgi:precorrin-6A/cobalt-precorrin-6A reductase
MPPVNAAAEPPANRPAPSAGLTSPPRTDKPGMPGGTVLILGGTAEGRALAAALADPALRGKSQPALPVKSDEPQPAFRVISSLAGRTREPLLPAGEVRIGGFGGIDGLVDYLRAQRIDVLVDATHPFAERISANASAAATITGVPSLVLRRPGWTEQAGDDWHRVPSLEAAAALLPRLGHRVFLTTGRQGIAAFAAADDCWFLARSVEPPSPPMPTRLEVLLDRGPFTVDGELRLLRDQRIDVLVSKDSGGADAKLTAAREQRIPVVLIDRPAPPPATAAAGSVAEAIAWLRSRR